MESNYGRHDGFLNGTEIFNPCFNTPAYVSSIYFIFVSEFLGSRDSSVDIESGYGLEGGGIGVRVPVRQEFSLLHVVQQSHYRVRVPCDSQPYFTVSDSRLSFSSPPTTRRATVFDPTSTRDSTLNGSVSQTLLL
jgi:hypothetical protein